MLIDPVFSLAIAASLALLLLTAAVHKLRQHHAFLAALAGYGVLPSAMLGAASRTIPLLECGLAASLAWPATRQFAALPAAALLLLYGAAMAATLVQGRRIADCGCSLGRASQQVTPALVWRNLALALLAAPLALQPAPRAMGAYGVASAAFAVLTGCALYALVNTLITNHYTTRELFHD